VACSAGSVSDCQLMKLVGIEVEVLSFEIIQIVLIHLKYIVKSAIPA